MPCVILAPILLRLTARAYYKARFFIAILEPGMKPYQKEFIEFAISQEVLKFGEFTLKSGRVSPYFFNAGLFSSGQALAKLGRFYAAALVEADVPYDVLFGPAYKGIPLATTTAVALYDHHNVDTPYVFNRKEKKAHGEGGSLVGANLEGRIMIIDDVITAGTAIREVMEIISQANASPAGVLIALDRQERGQGELSAIQEVERDFKMPVISIVSLHDIMTYLSEQDSADFAKHLDAVKAYRDQYGIE